MLSTISHHLLLLTASTKALKKASRLLIRQWLKSSNTETLQELVGQHLNFILNPDQPGGRTRDEMMKEGKEILGKYKYWRGGLTYRCADQTTFTTSAIVTVSKVGNIHYTISILENMELLNGLIENFEEDVWPMLKSHRDDG